MFPKFLWYSMLWFKACVEQANSYSKGYDCESQLPCRKDIHHGFGGTIALVWCHSAHDQLRV